MPREAWEHPVPDPVPAALDRGENTKGWDKGEDAGEPDDTEEREEHRRNWGGPGRGGGAHPKDPAAALSRAIRTLRHRLSFCRDQHIGAYAERQAAFSQIDALQELAEVYLCEAPDYPSQNNDE